MVLTMAMVCGLSLGGLCWAQEEAFCHLNKVSVEQLSNAVRLTLAADGVLKAAGDWSQFFVEVEPGDWRRRQARRFSFWLTNARSEVGAFVHIGIYPVSHLAIAIVPEAIGGVGLEVTLVLYTRAEARTVSLGDVRFRGYGYEEDINEVDISMGRNRRSLIITVTSDRYADVRAKPREPRDPGSLPRELAVRRRGEVLDVHALNVPLPELLDAVAREAGSQITTGSLTPRLVTLHLEGLSLPAVLEGLALAYGLNLTASPEGGPQQRGYVVSEGVPTGSASYSLGDLRVLPLRNISAEAASELLPNFLERYVHADPERNALVVGGPPQMLDKIAADLAEIDQAPPQMLVEMIFVETTNVARLAAALDLRFVDGTSAADWDTLSGDINYRIVREPDDLEIRLSALEARSAIRTVARPRATVVNGGRSEVFVGEERRFPFRTSRFRRAQEVTVASVDVGTRLVVYPWTGGEEITVWLRARSNNVVEVDEEGLPRVSAREARGVLRLGPDELALIGGLDLVQQERSRRKVPLLGDLPLVGSAFRSKTTETRATELAIFLRARIVDTAGQMASACGPRAPGCAREGRSAA